MQQNLKKLSRGDHLYFKTGKSIVFTGIEHHGIYYGGGEVIHLDGHSKRVIKSTLQEFCYPHSISSIEILDYTNPWSSFWDLLNIKNIDKTFDRETWKKYRYFKIKRFAQKKNTPLTKNHVILRAESLVNKQNKYHFGKRNCEHFSVWCKTNTWLSLQVVDTVNFFTKLLVTGGIAKLLLPDSIRIVMLVILLVSVFFICGGGFSFSTQLPDIWEE